MVMCFVNSKDTSLGRELYTKLIYKRIVKNQF